MKYNPLIHHRKSIRLKGYDYSKAGAYFITICCEDRINRFGKVVADEMILNQSGTIAYKEWINLADRFPNFELDVFQIMPNHMHGIIVLSDRTTVGATPAVAQEESELNSTTARVAPTIAEIVGAYKSIVSNACLQLFKSHNKTMGKLWQRNYYEHIIRDERTHNNISNYIVNNPSKWNEDKFH
ncbi:REP element-mobilizing transposase RayT [Pedobacter terrae]|uniref:REP element-mobilizing transposase RayT n=1 Tax=Pedobacter terrae TaxID=405671 RepID=A0A1G7YDK2_9SPHI|nr:transposase [Pedobacter terrae]SDG94443.1 REP element-mobilizing transposase RayT [Pedobacter terrae]